MINETCFLSGLTDHVSCVKCSRHVIHNSGKYYCPFCNLVFFDTIKHMEKASRVNLKSNNKINHFKKVLESITRSDSSDVELNEFRNYTSRIEENVDIFTVENYLRSLGKEKSNKYIYINNSQLPDEEIIANATKIFQAFLKYVQEKNPNYTIKYDFYVTKIFEYLKVPFKLARKTYKDNSKRAEDNLLWIKFLKYGNDNSMRFISEPIHETCENSHESTYQFTDGGDSKHRRRIRTIVYE